MEDETPGVDDDDDDEYNAAALAAAANNDDDAMDEFEKEESQELEATKKERAELLEAELKRKSSSATRVTSSNDKTSGEDDTAAEAVTGSMAYSRTRWDWARRYKRYHYWHTCARHAVSRDRILSSFPKPTWIKEFRKWCPSIRKSIWIGKTRRPGYAAGADERNRLRLCPEAIGQKFNILVSYLFSIPWYPTLTRGEILLAKNQILDSYLFDYL